MTTTWLVNGELKLVITPNSELEKSLLAQLAKRPVEIQILDKVQIADKQYADSVIITPKQSTDGK